MLPCRRGLLSANLADLSHDNRPGMRTNEFDLGALSAQQTKLYGNAQPSTRSIHFASLEI